MIDLLWLALRAAGFVVFLSAAGGALYLEIFRHELPGPAAARLRRRAQRWALAALLMVLAQGVCEPLRLAGAWEGIREFSLWRLAWASPVALGLWLRAAGLVALLAGIARRGIAWRALTLLGVLLILGAFLASGHTVTAAHRAPLGALLGLHTGVAAYWFGAVQALYTLRRVLEPQAFARLLQRFSAYALWLVPLLGLAGIGLAVALLPDAAALRRPYGLLLCLKAALFAVLLGLAALNRARLVPALVRGQPGASTALGHTLAAEVLLITGVLMATALLTGQFAPQE
jgi:copper resistance protein D